MEAPQLEGLAREFGKQTVLDMMQTKPQGAGVTLNVPEDDYWTARRKLAAHTRNIGTAFGFSQPEAQAV